MSVIVVIILHTVGKMAPKHQKKLIFILINIYSDLNSIVLVMIFYNAKHDKTEHDE